MGNALPIKVAFQGVLLKRTHIAPWNRDFLNRTVYDKAQDAMVVIDRAIKEVAIQRGEMGAFQKNTLESNLNWLRIAHENVQSSESVLRDADMAKEMAEFTRNQILMDASTSMLAHANQKTMSVLKLLG